MGLGLGRREYFDSELGPDIDTRIPGSEEAELQRKWGEAAN